MDYKKLAAVFASQGKYCLAKKIHREKNVPNRDLKLTIDNKELILRKGFIVRCFFSIFNLVFFKTNKKTYSKSYKLNDKLKDELECNYLFLFYDNNNNKLLSDGIKIITEFELRNGINFTEISCIVENLDLEFSANKNLIFAMIVGRKNDIYKGRYDLEISL